MFRPARLRSLYWRIAVGLVALLAALLVVQALVFLWMTGAIATTLLGQSPDKVAEQVAADVAAELSTRPDLDVDKYVKEHFGGYFQPLIVVLDDGRIGRNHEAPAIPGAPRGDWPRTPPGGWPPEPRTADDGRGPGGPAGPVDRGGPGGPGERATITVGGTRTGFVAVAGRGPRVSMLLREFGPTQAVIAVTLLVLGSAVASLAIFRPARRRLRELERVAEAIGEGDLSARASEDGGDEVTALAHAFNRMAGDLEARTSAMDASDRTRRQLLADVSHELKTPLAAIRGYVETLAMPELRIDDETRRHYLDIVGDETIKLEQIIGDLLDLARFESGGLALSCDDVPVTRLFQRVVDRHERETIEKQIALETNIEPGLELLWGDASRLEQALQNLVANAVRHTPDGGRVTLAAEKQGGRVHLSVRDTGPGVPADHLPRIFDRFYKADQSRSDPYSKSRSGLGLSIVKAIVERHSGTVTARNCDGGGAEFVIDLPPRPSTPAANA
ncbi:MAG: HAMP domain-containing sensor histidine kinase [Acidobacteria bacterium]|nr:HAMP domain-containing sensor histidine kinase [Acidobacteriota bacterium]